MFDNSDGEKSYYYSKYYLELVKIKFLLYIISTLFGVTSLNVSFSPITRPKGEVS